MRTSFYSNGDSTFTAPLVAIQSLANRSLFNARTVTPFRQCQGYTFGSKNSAISLVSRLLIACRPFQVTYFVMSFIVNTIQTMFSRWASSNFLQKCFVRIKTKFNPPSTVIGKTFHIRVIASSFSRQVGAVFHCIRMGFTVSQFQGSHTNPRTTSTRGGISTNKITTDTGDAISTLTQTVPHCGFAVRSCISDNPQLAKALICQDANRFTFFDWVRVYRKIILNHLLIMPQARCIT